jgi:hypothetical protein
MTEGVDRLLAQYENGRITRRDYLTQVAALLAAAPGAAAAEPAVGLVK